MIFEPLSIPGCHRVVPEPISDMRGSFARIFCAEEFGRAGLASDWVQVNTSFTREAGSVRGLHFQLPPRSEAKLVRCLRGAVWDVAVDLRPGSATFGRWCSLELTTASPAMIYIAPGCAHGFQTLFDDTELLYFHSAAYSPAHECGVHHADPDLAIDWPRTPTVISPRDAALPLLSDLDPIR